MAEQEQDKAVEMTDERIPGVCPKCGCMQFLETWEENGEERADWLCCIDPNTGDANDCDGKDTEPWDF